MSNVDKMRVLRAIGSLLSLTLLSVVLRYIFDSNTHVLEHHPVICVLVVVVCLIFLAGQTIHNLASIPDMEKELDPTFKSITKVY